MQVNNFARNCAVYHNGLMSIFTLHIVKCGSTTCTHNTTYNTDVLIALKSNYIHMKNFIDKHVYEYLIMNTDACN